MALSNVIAENKAIRSWFANGSYVDELRRIVYVETPKAACTTVKVFLRHMLNRRMVQFNPKFPSTTLRGFIHNRWQYPFATLTDFSPDRMDEIASDPSWFKFCVVRHPIDRFFAAWRDKVFLCEPEYERFLGPGAKKHVEFSDFFEHVMQHEDANSCDPHWRSQHALLLPSQIRYTKIYATRALPALRQDLKKHAEATGVDIRIPPLTHENTGLPIDPRGFLTRDVVARLRAFYDTDFRMFQFPEFEVADVPPTRAADFVTPFTDAIFDRNRVIAAHALSI